MFTKKFVFSKSFYSIIEYKFECGECNSTNFKTTRYLIVQIPFLYLNTDWQYGQW